MSILRIYVKIFRGNPTENLLVPLVPLCSWTTCLDIMKPSFGMVLQGQPSGFQHVGSPFWYSFQGKKRKVKIGDKKNIVDTYHEIDHLILDPYLKIFFHTMLQIKLYIYIYNYI